MKNQELYNKTVEILVQAYLNDTLQHDNCMACAVGNIVAGNCGFGFTDDYSWNTNRFHWAVKSAGWASIFHTRESGQIMRIENYHNEAKEQVDSTGYSVSELARIEYVFERAPNGDSSDEWMFNGLMAVIDVLDQIHENTDSELTTSTKSRFNKSLCTS